MEKPHPDVPFDPEAEAMISAEVRDGYGDKGIEMDAHGNMKLPNRPASGDLLIDEEVPE